MVNEIDQLPDPDSKSQRKRDMLALQELGEKLTGLTAGQLKKCALPEALLEAIQEYQRLPNKHGARHRQLQFIGKKMRDLSEEEIARATAQIDQDVTLVKRRYMALEKLRTDLLAGGKQAFVQLETEQPQADLEQIQQLIEKAEYERLQQSTPHASRKLFQLLRKLYGI
ncbi:MAG: hypothetical protein RLZZ227_759 [Pseudomonadota bacterium]